MPAHCRLAAALAAFALAAAALLPAPANAQPLAAAFDYSVPPRFALPPLGSGFPAGFPDEAGQLYADPLPPAGQENAFIDPASWPVDFDACASTGPIVEYRWSVDGSFVGAGAGCGDFSFAFPSEGSFEVSLTVVDAGANEASAGAAVEVIDWLIVSLGDSYASGEGVPDLPIQQADIDTADAAQGNADAAQVAFDAAGALLQMSEATLLQLQTDASALAALQAAYVQAVAINDACSGLECIQTAAALAAASAAFAEALLGLGLGALDLNDAASIAAALNGLLADAATARDAALAQADSAQSTLDAALDALDAALLALEPTWRNRRCHRSALAGPVQAARALEEMDPRSSVTFLHLPCSGATIPEGVLGPYVGIDPVVFNDATGMLEPAIALLPAQLDRARELVCGAACGPEDRSVDAFLLSVGGNDVNFAEIIETCIAGEPCFANPTVDSAPAAAFALLCSALGPFADECNAFYPSLAVVDAEDAFLLGVNEPPANGLDDLPGHYQALQDALTAAFGASAGSAMFLTEYPDVTRDESGAYCGWESSQSLAEQTVNLPGLSPAEFGWADSVVQTQLAGVMRTAAAAHGWSFVDGVNDAFANRGYCSNENRVVRLQESLLSQGDIEGTVHPNEAGQLAYRDALLVAVPEPAGGASVALGVLFLLRLAYGSRELQPVRTSAA